MLLSFSILTQIVLSPRDFSSGNESPSDVVNKNKKVQRQLMATTSSAISISSMIMTRSVHGYDHCRVNCDRIPVGFSKTTLLASVVLGMADSTVRIFEVPFYYTIIVHYFIINSTNFIVAVGFTSHRSSDSSRYNMLRIS